MAFNADVGRLAPNSDELRFEDFSSHSLQGAENAKGNCNNHHTCIGSPDAKSFESCSLLSSVSLCLCERLTFSRNLFLRLSRLEIQAFFSPVRFTHSRRRERRGNHRNLSAKSLCLCEIRSFLSPVAFNADVGRLAPNSDELRFEDLSSHSLKAQRTQRKPQKSQCLVSAPSAPSAVRILGPRVCN